MTQTEEILELREEVARLRGEIEDALKRPTVREAYNCKCNDCDKRAVTDYAGQVFVCAACWVKRMHELEMHQ